MSSDDILYQAESKLLIGCAIEVHNGVGYGYKKKPYENALVREFSLRGIEFQQQPRFDLTYKTR